jgi:ABC-type branched-subunit amino acid transport system ATPase component
VNEVSLNAPLGRLTGLIGPNGAGKTTLFNACTGLLRPNAGRISVFGDDVSRLGPAARAQRGLGRTFQRMELFDSLTVAENVAVGREAAMAGSKPLRQVIGGRGERAIVRDATAEALALCGLEPIAGRRAGALSTGQRRLVELARALAGPFRLLLLDEPSSGLDHAETERFGAILTDVVSSQGRGILLVEHHMALVMEVCEYLYVLDFGELIFEGTAAEVGASDVVRRAYLGEAA